MSDLTFHITGAAISAVIYAVSYVFHHYEFVVHSRDIRILKQLCNIFGIFVCVFISNAILTLTPEGDSSSFGIWMLCFFIGFTISYLAAFILLVSCRKLWPVNPSDDRFIRIDKIPSVLNVLGELVMVAMEIGLAVFFIWPILSGDKPFKDNILLSAAIVLIVLSCAVDAVRRLKKVFTS